MGIAVPAGTLVKIVRGILRQEQDHYSFLFAPAPGLVTSFSFPSDPDQRAPGVGFPGDRGRDFAAAYLAANREFAMAGWSRWSSTRTRSVALKSLTANWPAPHRASCRTTARTCATCSHIGSAAPSRSSVNWAS
jgi:hypothetical protein